MAVVALEREGGQAQFIVHPPPPSDGESLAPLLAWIEQNLHRDLSLLALARRAAMSTRTLSRRFREQTGHDARAVGDARARAARAAAARDDRARGGARGEPRRASPRATTLRVQFQRIVGTSPKAYRRAFRGAGLSTLSRADDRLEHEPDSPRTLLECMRSMPSAGTS